ncbi:MAG: S9 family peptidase [Ezakiella sp.]|nr:S9 family peptidase [Ezakiella sp.]
MNRIKLNDFFEYKFLSNPTLKEGRIYFNETVVSEDGKDYVTSLSLIDNGKYKKLTEKGGSGFIFLNKDEILFVDERDGLKKEEISPKTTIYKLDLTGGEAQKFLSFDRALSLEGVLDNYIIMRERYNPLYKDYEDASEDERKSIVKKADEEKDYMVFDEIPFWSNGAGLTNKIRSRLVIYDMIDKSMHVVTDNLTNVEQIDIDYDNKRILFSSSSFNDRAPLFNKLHIYDIKKKESINILPESELRVDYAHFFKDMIIVIASEMKKHGLNENGELMLVDPKLKKITKTSDPDLSFWSSVGSDVRYGGGTSSKVFGDYLYITSTDKYNCNLFKVDMELNLTKITDIEGSIDAFDIEDDKIIAVALLNQDLQELYEINDGKLNKISNLNNTLEGKYVAIPERIDWEKEDYEFSGWILKPEDFDKLDKVPVILDIHGGPKTVYGSVFYHEMQYWVNLGYAVIFTNPRGGDGYGDEFMDIFGDYGGVDYEDIMDFVDRMLEKYKQLDRDNLFVTGGSYGGFMTNWIIGHTDRFKAAASQRSISNWISMWGISDIGYYFASDQTKSDIWDSHEKMWGQSPLKYANKVSTPTLFIHSDCDYRCPFAEGVQMFTALKYHGVESRFIMFKGENHELSRSGKPHHRLRRLDEITTWFDKHKGN